MKRILTLCFAVALAAAGCTAGGESEAGGESDSGGAVAAPPVSADVQPPAVYNGEVLELTIPFGPGGGNDVIARFTVPFLKEGIDGISDIVIVNEPGGGSVLGANNFVLTKPADGTNILSTSTSTMMPWFLGQSEVRYDFADLIPIAGWPASRILYVRPGLGITEAKDLATNEVTLGGRSATGQDVILVLLLEALGVRDNVTFVFGYRGSGEQFLAYEQGEVDGNSYPTTTYFDGRDKLAESGELLPLLTFGMPDGRGGFDRDPMLPDLPTAAEVYQQIHGAEPSGPAWEAFSMFINLNGQFNYGHWVRGDTPAEAVAALRAGYVAAMTAPVLEAGREVWGPYPPVLGEEALGPVTELFQNVDQSVLQWVRDFLTQEYDADL